MHEQNETPDLLYGVPAIAAFLGLKEKQCRHRIDDGLIPSFRIGVTICARKSSLVSWLKQREDQARLSTIAPVGGR